MNELVKKLAKGKHDVIVGGTTNSDNPHEEFKAAVDREFVHVRFVKTKGGTELGFQLDQECSDFSKADFTKGTGKVKLAGNISLNYVPVRVVADINLKSLSGKGFLEIRDSEASNS